MNGRPKVYGALLRHWRERAGLSQLDLSLAADVSARHLSCLETGRAQPSRQMVLRLGHALDVSLRDRNQMLRASGHAAVFDEPDAYNLRDDQVGHALDVMLRHHEPFPMLVLDRAYGVVRTNQATMRLARACDAAMPERWNGLEAFFDPALMRPHLLDWQATARHALARLHLEVLQSPEERRLQALLDRILAFPGVREEFRHPNPSTGSAGVLAVRFRVKEQTLSFLVTINAFQAPQNVTLNELRIESYLPADADTEAACRALLSS